MTQRFTLRPAPPIRALAISAGLDVLAVIVLVVALVITSSVLTVIALVVLVLGLALALLAWLGHRRLTTVVEVDDHGIAIRSAGRQAHRPWNTINHVRAQADRLYLSTDDDDGETLQIICPRGSADPEVERLARTLSRRLDQDRGYQSL